MSKGQNLKFLIAWLCLYASLLLSVESAIAANPSAATLSFTYGGESGRLRVVNLLNRDPENFCRMTLRGQVYYEGDSEFASRRSITSRRIMRTKRFVINIYNLPAVNPGPDSKAPILTMQTRTVCGSRVILSNAAAKFVTCGRGSQGVGPSEFLNTLQRRL